MYEIADYDERYRPYNKSGEPLQRADWVKLPVNPKGDGLQKLLKYRRGLEVFAVWCLLLEKTTAEKKPENRGKLLNHQEQSASIAEIADGISLNRKVPLVEYAIKVLLVMGWVVSDEDVEQASAQLPPTPTKSSVIKSRVEKSNKGGFRPPTTQEISDYCKEKNIYVDAQDFIDFYESKGWMVGKNKMVDWRRAVCRARKWEINASKQPPSVEGQQQKEQTEKAALERERERIRREDGPYWREQTDEKLQKALKNPLYTTRHWLIREILEARKAGE